MTGGAAPWRPSADSPTPPRWQPGTTSNWPAPTRTISVFVDTSALYALLSRHGQAHAAARHSLDRLRTADEMLVTHNYVVLETVALAQHRLGLEAVAALRDGLLAVITLACVERDLHDRALAATTASARREVSFVEQVSFALMRGRGIRRAFAFDPHFEQEGFELIE